jgi:hypothetical protein
MVIDLEIETGDHATEAGPHILIGCLEARRERERRNTPTDLEVTHEDSRFITKTPHKSTRIAHEFRTKT